MELTGKKWSEKALLVWEPTEQWEGPSPRPKSGVTLKVWEVADELMAKLGRIPTKMQVISEAFNRHQVRVATTKVQYGKWLKSLEVEKRGEIKS